MISYRNHATTTGLKTYSNEFRPTKIILNFRVMAVVSIVPAGDPKGIGDAPTMENEGEENSAKNNAEKAGITHY